MPAINQLFRSLAALLRRPQARRAVARAADHVFRKHPARHADKAVQAAFKVGLATARHFTRR